MMSATACNVMTCVWVRYDCHRTQNPARTMSTRGRLIPGLPSLCREFGSGDRCTVVAGRSHLASKLRMQCSIGSRGSRDGQRYRFDRSHMGRWSQCLLNGQQTTRSLIIRKEQARRKEAQRLLLPWSAMLITKPVVAGWRVAKHVISSLSPNKFPHS